MVFIRKGIKIFIVLIVGSWALSAYGANFSGDILAGYNGGLGFQINFITADFAHEFPMNLQIDLIL